MNRSRNAAVLMLIGSFAVGGGVTYAGSKVVEAQRSRRPECPQPRTENNYRQRFYEQMGFSSQQTTAFDSLIDARNKAVGDVITVPRAKSDSVFAAARVASDSILAAPKAKADSIRRAVREKQEALFTPAQRAKLDAQNAAMKKHQAERDAQRAQCERPQGKQGQEQNNRQPTKSKSNH